mgnify:CR=1 FL=1
MDADWRFADIKLDRRSGQSPRSRSYSTRSARTRLDSWCATSPIASSPACAAKSRRATRCVDKKIDVLVRSVDARAASIEEIRNLIVNPGSAQPVPLSAVADVTARRRSRRDSPHRPGARRGRFSKLHREATSVAAVDDLQGMLEKIALPPSASTAYLSGPERGDAGQLPVCCSFALLLAMFLVYLVMASQFESLVHPFVILFTIPLGADRRGLGAVAHRHDRQRRGIHRAHHAGGHRRQPVDRADRRGRTRRASAA